MTRLHTRLLLGASLVAGLSLTAIAAPGKMQNLDTNGDTIIDKTEFLAGASEKFTAMDIDVNGLVTEDERQAFRAAKAEERAQKRFANMDANGDGSVSEEEYASAREAKREMKRARHDITGDGVIDEADKEARAERRQARDAERQGKRDGRHEGRHEGRQRFEIDANNDGFIDLAENTAAAEFAFTRMDKNGDGVLTEDEQRRRRHHGGRKRHGNGR